LKPWSDRKKGIAGLLIFILVPALVTFVVPPPPEAAPPVLPHAPIAINGDSQFTPENGVVSGNGSAADPYIIGNLNISAADQIGLTVRNAFSHFIISGVRIHSGSYHNQGILLHDVENATIMNSTLTDNHGGIGIHHSTNVTILGNNLSLNHGWNDGDCAGICIEESSQIRIEANEFHENFASAIYAEDIKDALVVNNRVILTYQAAFHFRFSENLTIANNLIDTVYGGGISVQSSRGIVVDENQISVHNETYAGGGLELDYNEGVTVRANIFQSVGMIVKSYDRASYESLTITSDNLVNGQPIAYYKDCVGLAVEGLSVGQLIVANCTDITIHDMDFSDTDVGVQLAHSSNATLSGISMTENKLAAVAVMWSKNITVKDSDMDGGTRGVLADSYSENISIKDNSIRNQRYSGVFLERAYRVDVSFNVIAKNAYGMVAYSSRDFTISRNNISDNKYAAVGIDYGKDFYVEDNRIANNGNGTEVYDSTNGVFSRNLFERDGISISGRSLEAYESHMISTNNTVNGLPISFVKGCSDREIDGEFVGQLIIVNCTNIHISHLTMTDVDIGIAVSYSDKVSVEWSQMSSSEKSSFVDLRAGMDFDHVGNLSLAHNSVSNSVVGISVDYCDGVEVVDNSIFLNVQGIDSYESSNGTLARNSLHHNTNIGMILSGPSNFSIFENEISQNRLGLYVVVGKAIRVYHNNFVGNDEQAEVFHSEPAWDDGHDSGGNYWSDYQGADVASGANQTSSGADGIGDTPYVFDWDGVDRYPLMRPYGSPPMESAQLWPLILIFAGFAWAVFILVIWQRGRNTPVHQPDNRST